MAKTSNQKHWYITLIDILRLLHLENAWMLWTLMDVAAKHLDGISQTQMNSHTSAFFLYLPLLLFMAVADLYLKGQCW